MTPKHTNYKNLTVGLALTLLLATVAVGGFYFYKNIQTLDLTKIELANTQSDLADSEAKAKYLSESLDTERYKNSLFSGQINEILGTVGKLDKLSKTDKELLQKYSKIYFLNENYIPEALTLIPSEFVYEKDKEIKIHTKVLPELTNLLKSAQSNGRDLKIISGFRSFAEQSTLKGAYTFTYGSDANKFSADQGYSEHQLGTTVDFTTASVGATFSGFAKTPEYKWLLENAYRYGFVISYPEANTYYQFEPWHWRFVGRELAERLREENQNFYDLEQRTIDTYLINIFD